MVMEGDLTLGSEYTTQYTDMYYRIVYLKPTYFINQCHPNKFHKYIYAYKYTHTHTKISVFRSLLIAPISL